MRSVLEWKTPARRRIPGERRAMRACATHDHATPLIVRDGDVAAQHLRAVTHELHAHAVVARVSLIETPTVVLNAEGQCALCRGEVNCDLRDASVADRIGERLLRDAIKVRRSTIIERQRLLEGGIEMRTDAIAFHSPHRHRLQPGDEATT